VRGKRAADKHRAEQRAGERMMGDRHGRFLFLPRRTSPLPCLTAGSPKFDTRCEIFLLPLAPPHRRRAQPSPGYTGGPPAGGHRSEARQPGRNKSRAIAFEGARVGRRPRQPPHALILNCRRLGLDSMLARPRGIVYFALLADFLGAWCCTVSIKL
jgi:hypothetical protein